MVQCLVSLPELTCQFFNWIVVSVKITEFQATENLAVYVIELGSQQTPCTSTSREANNFFVNQEIICIL
jgi:hypothetical protein